MQSVILNAVLVTLYLTTIPSTCFTLPIIDDIQFNNLLKSNNSFGIIPLRSVKNEERSQSIQKQNFSYLTDALPTLSKHNVQLFFFNCKGSELDICNFDESTPLIHLYKNHKHIQDLYVEAMNNQYKAEGLIVDSLKTNLIKFISSLKNWKKFIKTHKGNKNIILFYLSQIGNKFHNFMLNAAYEFKDQILFAYTTSEEVLSKIIGVSQFQAYEVWIFMCTKEFIDSGKCLPFKYSSGFSSSNFIETFKAMLKPSFTEIDASSPIDYYTFIQSSANEEKDVLVFAPGHTKEQKARQLAKTSCVVALGFARCILITGNINASTWLQPVAANRIRLSVLTYEPFVPDIDVGYLQAESRHEVFDHWKQPVYLRRLLHGDDFNSLIENDQPLASVYDIQDDPVVFSVHSLKSLRDFYLFDYKTLPRLTDVTYDQVVNGEEYAVIVFTLEFNAKSLATLSHVLNIHQKLKEYIGKSPLYRLECFDWPDVCAKANVTSFPRMFFHKRSTGEKSIAEYSDIWSHSHMRKAIILHSLQWPALSAEEIPIVAEKVIYGLIATDQGEKTFREVANKLGDQYAFCMIRNLTEANAISKQIGSQWPTMDSLIGRLEGHYQKPFKIFETADDIVSFIDESFNHFNLTELTEANFKDHLFAPIPLFIQYTDHDAGLEEADKQLTSILTSLRKSGIYKDKANFVWMDIFEGGPGRYTLSIYSKGKFPPSPLVYISKNGTVSFKSFQKKPTEQTMIDWIDLCLSGNAPVAYRLLDDDWLPRMDGYDYLRSLKIDQKIYEDTRVTAAKRLTFMKNFVNNSTSFSSNSESTVFKHTEL